MKKGEIYEGIIEKVDFPNKGYVQVDDQKVLIKNGIPGQNVRFMIQKKRSGRAQGRIMEVLEKSPLETREPVCSNFPACGGCMYQTMSYENQLEMKDRQIRELLEDALIQGGQTDAEGKADFEWEATEARSNLGTAIRWNFPLVMNTRTDRFLSVCTRRAALMTS